jgi:hypothetical protein
MHFNNFLSARARRMQIRNVLSRKFTQCVDHDTNFLLPHLPLIFHPMNFYEITPCRLIACKAKGTLLGALCTRSLDRVPVYSGKNEPPESDKMLQRVHRFEWG